MRRNDGKEPIFAERRVGVGDACVGYNYKICSCRPHTLREVFSSRHCTLRQPRRLAERARRSAYVRISVTIARLCNTPVPVMYRYLNTKDLAEKTQRMKCRQTCRHFLPTLPTLPTLVMCVGSVGADSADMSAKMPTLSLPTLVSADTLVLPTLFESGLAADNRYTRYIDYQL